MKKINNLLFRITPHFFEALALILASMFYLFGALEAVIKQNPNLYLQLIGWTFTVAGFSIAATAFASSKKEKLTKYLLLPTVYFITAGFLMYFNIIVAEFVFFQISITNEFLKWFVGFSLLMGYLGILLFLWGLRELILNLLTLYKNYEK